MKVLNKDPQSHPEPLDWNLATNAELERSMARSERRLTEMYSKKVSLENVTPLGVDVTKVRAPLAYVCGYYMNVTPQASCP